MYKITPEGQQLTPPSETLAFHSTSSLSLSLSDSLSAVPSPLHLTITVLRSLQRGDDQVRHQPALPAGANQLHGGRKALFGSQLSDLKEQQLREEDLLLGGGLWL